MFTNNVSGGKRKSILFLVFTLIAIVPGLRGDVGQDTYNYLSFYNNFFDGRDVFLWFLRYEPGYVTLTYLLKTLNDNETFYFFSIAIIQSFLLFKAVNNIKSPYIFVAIYLVTYYLNFHFNVLRVGIALLFYLVALSHSSNRKSVLLLVAAVSFHLSILVFIPFFMYSKRMFNSKIIVLFLSLALFFVSLLGDRILLKLKSYQLLESNPFSDFSTISIIFIVIASVLTLIPRKSDKVIILSFLQLSLFFLLKESVDILYRLYELSLVIFFFVLCQKGVLRNGKLKTSAPYLYGAILLIWTIPLLWHFYFLEKQYRIDNGDLIDYTYIPYELYYTSDDRKN